MDTAVRQKLIEWAEIYNDRRFFLEDPIAFPRRFAGDRSSPHWRENTEIAAVFAAHFAWGRRSMIVRDCTRLFEEMRWQPYEYVMAGEWKDEPVSVHRTIKWSDVAAICARLRGIYLSDGTIAGLSVERMRTDIFGSSPDPSAANKKINMMRRWMVRDDGRVDLGVWNHLDKRDLLIPLDVHVHRSATSLGLCTRRYADFNAVREITDALREVFPDDPCKGDFALFGHGCIGGTVLPNQNR